MTNVHGGCGLDAMSGSVATMVTLTMTATVGQKFNQATPMQGPILIAVAEPPAIALCVINITMHSVCHVTAELAMLPSNGGVSIIRVTVTAIDHDSESGHDTLALAAATKLS